MRKLLLGIATLSAISGLGLVAAFDSPQTTKAVDSPLVTQVDQLNKQSVNHEARITNTEGDVKDLQNKTGVPPSVTRVEVPVVTPAPEVVPTPAPEPVKVASSVLRIDNSGHYCDLTYSDGSTDFKKNAYHLDVFGNAGYDDNCGQFIGQLK